MKAFAVGTGGSGVILGLNWNWAILWSPGVVFIIVALLTVAIQGMKGSEVSGAWKDTGKQVSGAAIALLFGVAMVNIFRYTNVSSDVMDGSMLLIMARGLAALAGHANLSLQDHMHVLRQISRNHGGQTDSQVHEIAVLEFLCNTLCNIAFDESLFHYLLPPSTM